MMLKQNPQVETKIQKMNQILKLETQDWYNLVTPVLKHKRFIGVSKKL